MAMSMFDLNMRSLLELKQIGTVVEYTAAFWERLHRVLDLNSNLNIKSFVHHYVEGLREDIQAAVRSRSPSSITCASCLARIREEEIVKDTAMGADKLGDTCGLAPTETLTGVFPEHTAPVQCRAGHGVTTIDVSCLVALTPTTCSTQCPSHDATASTSALTSTATPNSSTTTINVFPKLAALAEHDEDLDFDIIGVAAPTPATDSLGGLAHGSSSDSPAVSLFLWSTTPSSAPPSTTTPTSLPRSSPVLEILSTTPAKCLHPQGWVFRPTPWPSFVAKHKSTTCNGIVEPPLSVLTASRRDVIPYSLPLLPFTLEVFWQFSPGSGHAGPAGHREAAPYRGSVSRVVTTLVPPPVTGDIRDDKPSYGSITEYQWFIYNESSGVARATTESEMLQLLSNLSNSPSIVLVNTLHISSVISCLGDVLWRLKKYWSYTQCVQLASAIFLNSSCSTLRGSHNHLAMALLVGSVCKVRPKDFSTSLAGVQVTGYPHVWRHGQHCRIMELSSRAITTNLLCWLLHMGNISSCLRVLNQLRSVNKLPGTIRIAGTGCYSVALFAIGKPEMCLQHELLLHLLRTSDQEETLNPIPAMGEQIMSLCSVKLGPWPYNVLHFVEPCGFWLAVQRFVVMGRLASGVDFSISKMALLQRDISQLQTWPPPPCIQCTVPTSDGNCWCNSWLVLHMFSYISSLEVLVGSHITGPLALNKLTELAEGKGALLSEYMIINLCCVLLQVEALIYVTPLWPFSNCFNGSQGIIHVHCLDTMKLLSSEWLSWLFVPVGTCTLGHGSELYAETQWDHELMNRVCRATLLISAALNKSCACAAPVNNGVPNYLAYSVAVIGLRARADMWMFEINDIWPSTDLHCGTHHDWDLMLLGSTHGDFYFEGSLLGYDSDGDHSGYATFAIGCWSTSVVPQVQTTWYPGGSAVHWYLITGLRTSRVLRGRECHAPGVRPVLSFWALLQKSLWSLGWAQLQEYGPMLIHEKTSTGGGH